MLSDALHPMPLLPPLPVRGPESERAPPPTERKRAPTPDCWEERCVAADDEPMTLTTLAGLPPAPPAAPEAAAPADAYDDFMSSMQGLL